MIGLGVETSCDETSVALLEDAKVIASRTYTQEIHAGFGGVVPEAASREHLAKIEPLSMTVLREAGIGPADIGMIAVTDSPGLAGALLVGISFCLGLRSAFGPALTGINHLEGHICSVFLDGSAVAYPFIALVVSGGHTALYRVDGFGEYQCLGQTVDDAAGEAFDKVGKMLGFSYPAGRQIEREASRACPQDALAFRFPVARLPGLDFSFSGLKTSVRYLVTGKSPEFFEEHRPALCRAFQKAVIDSLVSTAKKAAGITGIRRLVTVGGVACNQSLRDELVLEFGSDAHFPSPHFCTDNAAMIARAGYERMLRGTMRPPRMNPSGHL